MTHHSGITLRKYGLHSVDDDAAHTLSQRAVSGGLPITAWQHASVTFGTALGTVCAQFMNYTSAQSCEFDPCIHVPSLATSLQLAGNIDNPAHISQ